MGWFLGSPTVQQINYPSLQEIDTHAHAPSLTHNQGRFPCLGSTLNEKCPSTITHSNIVLATV